VDHPNPGKVDEIGFTDLMNGASSPACTRLDWIEVLREDRRRSEQKS